MCQTLTSIITARSSGVMGEPESFHKRLHHHPPSSVWWPARCQGRQLAILVCSVSCLFCSSHFLQSVNTKINTVYTITMKVVSMVSPLGSRVYMHYCANTLEKAGKTILTTFVVIVYTVFIFVLIDHKKCLTCHGKRHRQQLG